jgi:hypothetical protein
VCCVDGFLIDFIITICSPLKVNRHFGAEDGGHIPPKCRLTLSMDCTALYPRRQYSSTFKEFCLQLPLNSFFQAIIHLAISYVRELREKNHVEIIGSTYT